ncbi:MAG: bifunctional anthranilate synthase component I family protein/class IV aminotransferase [Melioribacteraceae bacterium]
MQIIEILKYVEENQNSAFFYTPNIFEEGKSYFFKKPFQILKGSTKNEVNEILDKVDLLLQDKNLIGFATIPYEIGYFFQPKVIKNSYQNTTELTFYFYEKQNVEIFTSQKLKFDEAEKFIGLKNIKKFKINISKSEYINKIEKIKNYISKGDTYQINFTSKAKFDFIGNILSLFLSGIFNQSAGYSVLINNDKEFILSFSPELFFTTDYKTIISKPMKGTVKRKGNPNEDLSLIKQIQNDEKNLAENVMIVDLLRNDIGKIAKINSVKVEKLCEVEKYETLLQLTSTVVGKLKTKKLSEIIRNLFPSGSITGAPKIRSMQIIAELEKSPRNLYTGSIGLITNQKSVFNIPIRTININKKNSVGELGLGSGVVWDSDPLKEFDEVLLKGKFISNKPKYFELLETMLFENGKYFLLNLHVQRLKTSAEYFLFKFDEVKINAELNNILKEFKKEKKYKIRLLLNKWGIVKIDFEEIKNKINSVKVILSNQKRCNEEKFIFNKTTLRPWDNELNKYKQKGFDEVLFVNEKNEILEGAITNIIIEKKGKLYTPHIKLGILNGCYRSYLLSNKKCEEKILTISDLKNADKIVLCNSVRKEIIVNEIYDFNFLPFRKF